MYPTVAARLFLTLRCGARSAGGEVAPLELKKVMEVYGHRAK